MQHRRSAAPAAADRGHQDHATVAQCVRAAAAPTPPGLTNGDTKPSAPVRPRHPTHGVEDCRGEADRQQQALRATPAARRCPGCPNAPHHMRPAAAAPPGSSHRRHPVDLHRCKEAGATDPVDPCRCETAPACSVGPKLPMHGPGDAPREAAHQQLELGGAPADRLRPGRPSAHQHVRAAAPRDSGHQHHPVAPEHDKEAAPQDPLGPCGCEAPPACNAGTKLPTRGATDAVTADTRQHHAQRGAHADRLCRGYPITPQHVLAAAPALTVRSHQGAAAPARTARRLYSHATVPWHQALALQQSGHATAPQRAPS